MPNILSDLFIDEVSLVDSPANSSIDPITGKKRKHAVVALFKRDDTGDEPSPFKKSINKESKKMEFEQILKSAKTRDDVVAAVRQKAQERVAKKGGNGSLTDAEAKVWEKYPEAVAKYEALPKPSEIKPQSALVSVTKAEGILDSRAKRIMKRDGLSYPQACSQVLTEDPSLYTRYCEEMSRGEKFPVPESLLTKASGRSFPVDDPEDAADDGDDEDEEDTGDLTPERAKKAMLRKIREIDDLKARIVKMERAAKVYR